MQDAAHVRSPNAPAVAAVDEAALLVRVRAGDRDAFERLAVRAMPMLLGTARRLLRDRFAAEETVAEALFRALRHVHTFRGDSGFGTWLHRILCRVAADRYRTQARDAVRRAALSAHMQGDRSQPSAGASPGRRLALREEGERLRATVEALPPWEDLALGEISEVLGMRYATVKSNLHHARRTLRSLLEGTDVPDGGGR
jgi:RNA polymerase sigma-70 factor (ECF subfamily)